VESRPRPSVLEREDATTDVNGSADAQFGRARVVLALTFAAIVVFAFAGAVDAIAFFDEQGDQSAAATPLDRAYGYDPDGLELVPDQEVVEDAVAAMPEGDPYRIVLGSRFRSILRIPWSRAIEADFLRQHLLPRRERDDATWVFCFDCDPETLDGFEVLSKGPGGLEFGRVGQ
jgi:hypothetical protein